MYHFALQLLVLSALARLTCSATVCSLKTCCCCHSQAIANESGANFISVKVLSSHFTIAVLLLFVSLDTVCVSACNIARTYCDCVARY
jgi:hypothetical protein